MIPIVANADLLAAGLIQSLARPGGNTTGVSMLSAELDAKRLEILKEILPSARRIALLTRAGYPAPAQRQAIADLAQMLGVELETVEIRDRTDLASAFVSLRAGGRRGDQRPFYADAFRCARRAWQPQSNAQAPGDLRMARNG